MKPVHKYYYMYVRVETHDWRFLLFFFWRKGCQVDDNIIDFGRNYIVSNNGLYGAKTSYIEINLGVVLLSFSLFCLEIPNHCYSTCA